MKRLSRALSIAFLLKLAAPLAATELPGRDDYAFGFPMTVDGDAKFFALDVPDSVYRAVYDPQLRDAGVFNADGQPVPRVFERPEPEREDVEQMFPLGLVPLYGTQTQPADTLRLLLHRDAEGTTLDLNSGQGSDARVGARSDQPLTAYIVDARELDKPLRALAFDWEELPEAFIGTVTVEDSDDLQHWRKLGSTTLAALEHEETQIQRRRIRLAREVADFLRVTWQNMPGTWRLNAVNGIYTTRAKPAKRRWTNLDPAGPGEREREWVYEADGYFPADRVSLILPGDTIVVRASVFHRRDESETWQFAYNGVFHSITRKGKTVRSAPAAIPETRAGQWMIRLSTGVPAEPVQLRLGWRPDRLLFVAQGPQPFELVAGRAGDALDNFPQERMLGDRAIFESLRESSGPGAASLGQRRAIAGAKALDAPAASKLRAALLWAGLIAAIGVVGWLVYSLTREMRESP